MKKIIAILLAVALLTLSLLVMVACGKVEGNTYAFDSVKCRWDDDATEKQKTDFVNLMKLITGDDTLTTKNVLDKWEDILTEANKNRSYTFDEGGTLGGTFTGTWEKDGDEIDVTIMGITTELDIKMGKLVQNVSDYDYVDAYVYFKKK